MTKKQEAVERLARFMGWRWDDGGIHKGSRLPWRGQDGQAVASEFFNPFTRIEDAFIVARTIPTGLMLEHGVIEGFWYANFNGGNIINTTRCDRSPSEAITLAALAYLDAVEKE